MAANARIAPVADAILGAALAHGARLVERATAQGLAFGLDQLGDLDIPEPEMARVDKAQMRALATLYLAADLEPAGIIPAVEALAGLASTGALGADLGAAGPLVAHWWQHRTQRPNAAERDAFFARLFGTSDGPVAAEAPRNVQFEDRMLELCESLYKLDDPASGGSGPTGGTVAQARARNAAKGLVENLGNASGGITAFLAGEIVAMLKDAFAIVGHAELRRAFAARDLWDVVGAVGRIAHSSFRPAAPYVRRGKAGMIVIAWLADVADRLAGPTAGPIVSIGDPVVGAAIDWLEATLDIGEANPAAPVAPPPAAAAPPPRLPPAAPASPWSALGG